MRPSLRHVPRILRTAQPAGRAAQFVLRPAQPSRHLSATSPVSTAGPNPSTTGPSSSSVNATEISHFSALASSWWDPHGPSRPLHLMNPLRHDFIQSCLASTPTSPQAPLRYLDVGCGGGIFAESAARHPSAHSVTAIDPSSTILTIARAHAKRDPALGGKLTYLNETIESLPMPEQKYDVVTLFEVIEHVDYPAEFLSRLAQFVRPGGWLVLSTIARTWTSWVTTNLVAEDILGMVPKGTHDWNKYVNVDEMRAWFEGGEQRGKWGPPRVMGVVFVPGFGWKEVKGSEKVGNYFWACQRLDV